MSVQGQAIADIWDQTFNKGDTAALGKLYSRDGKVIPAGGTSVQGPEGIAAFFADLQSKGFKDHKITVEDATLKGETLLLTGRWQLNGPGDSGDTQSYGGNWVNVLERQGDDWRTLLHTWN
ncbi:YybH family protein [Methylobacterium sp.]|jgi:ketosteroid isomerase-like protein|uniref:YybH family protein n=1 Tax=Methylobacterium sp. TaxID=409 RepID=UPI003B02BACE